MQERFINIRYILAFLTTIPLCLAIWIGFFGYGIDYYRSYSVIGRNWSIGPIDWLGWEVSTFGICEVHVGVLLISLLLSYGTFTFTFNRLRISGLNIILVNILLICYPLLFFSVNVMRQGLFLSIYFIILKTDSKIFRFFLIFLLPLAHNVGIVFCCFLLIEIFFNWKPKLQTLLYFLATSFLATFLFYTGTRGHVKTGLDMSLFYSITSFLILLTNTKYSFLPKHLPPVMLLQIVIFLLGMPVESERLFLIYLIPVVIYSSRSKFSNRNLFVFSTVVLVFNVLTWKWNGLT